MKDLEIAIGCGGGTLPELINIYNACFDDGTGYADMLFSRRIDPSLAVTAKSGKAICGAFCFIPLSVCGKKGVMLYALGVLPEYRGRGIGGALVSFAKDYCKKNGLVCLLHPADNGLFGYYEKLGFNDKICSKLAVYHGREYGLRIRALTSSDYCKRRNGYLAGRPSVVWNEDDVGYAVLENAFCGGLCVGGDDFIALLSREKGRVTVRELLTDRYESASLLKRYALAAGSMCGVSDVSAVYPVWYADGIRYRSALAYNMPEDINGADDLFFGLMLD
ncbi:MAG: GNAT family N-acetyltransferase [Clostridia bacterium]|nr:GNAT family N-acetyltransferase [Clostridia bacterium]